MQLRPTCSIGISALNIPHSSIVFDLHQVTASPKTWLRVKSNANLFAEVAQRSYLEYLGLEARHKESDEEDIEPMNRVERQHYIAGVQTILFAGMSFEAAIYDYAATP